MSRALHLIGCVALTLLLAGLARPVESKAAQLPGVHAHLLWSNVDDAEMDRQLDLAKRGGAKIVRTDLGWATLEEGGKGQFARWYLRRVDRLVDAAQARGLKLLIGVVNSPCWASTAPADLKQDCSSGWWGRGVGAYPPADPVDYADAMAFLAARYSGRVAAWEIWNEPNLDGFWNSPDPPRDYTELVKVAYPRIKAADPAATVVAGGLANSDRSWVESMYEAGIEGSFDALSIHPYSGDNSPLDPLEPSHVHGSFLAGVPAVRRVMQDHGDSRPMWLTEFGYNTSLIRGSEPWLNGVSESTQAQWLEDAYAQMQEWPYVDVGVWYNLKDRGTDRYDKDENYGLVAADDSPKPAFAAYQRAAAAVTASSPAPPPAEEEEEAELAAGEPEVADQTQEDEAQPAAGEPEVADQAQEDAPLLPPIAEEGAPLLPPAAEQDPAELPAGEQGLAELEDQTQGMLQPEDGHEPGHPGYQRVPCVLPPRPRGQDWLAGWTRSTRVRARWPHLLRPLLIPGFRPPRC